MKRASWITMGILSTAIGFYPISYFLNGRDYKILASKSAELLSDNLWNIGFFGHIVLGGFALLIGWLQFSNKLRKKNIKLHRKIGKAYVISVLISGICGLYIAFYATGGIICVLGFGSLAVIWLTTTTLSFKAIKEGNVELHQKLMIYSYAACFGAVTLRIWLPILRELLGGFINAYRIVAWLAWVPNIMVAYFIVHRKKQVAKTVQI